MVFKYRAIKLYPGIIGHSRVGRRIPRGGHTSTETEGRVIMSTGRTLPSEAVLRPIVDSATESSAHQLPRLPKPPGRMNEYLRRHPRLVGIPITVIISTLL